MTSQKLELTWIGKDQRPRLEPRILQEKPNRSYHAKQRVTDKDIFDNRLIKGDNLLALKALEAEFAGQVKCIYIDPPFNTGAMFEHYDDGVEHSIWLGLMRDRLMILHRLLHSEGVIWIHIDDKEMAYLRVLCDEVFGRANFLNMIVVKTSDPSGHKTVNPSPYSQTEYVLMYAKSRYKYQYEQRYVASGYDQGYNKFVINREAPFNDWSVVGLNEYVAQKLNFSDTREARKKLGRLGFDALVAQFALENSKSVFQSTAISNVAGRSIVDVRDKSAKEQNVVFRIQRDGFEDIFVLNGRKMYFYSSKVKEIDGELTPAKPLTNLWTDIPYNGIAREGGVEFKNGKKPERLIERCIDLCTNPGDLVLDSFAGSGTTGAVAHKMWPALDYGGVGRALPHPHRSTPAKSHRRPRPRRRHPGHRLAGRRGFSLLRAGAHAAVHRPLGQPGHQPRVRRGHAVGGHVQARRFYLRAVRSAVVAARAQQRARFSLCDHADPGAGAVGGAEPRSRRRPAQPAFPAGVLRRLPGCDGGAGHRTLAALNAEKNSQDGQRPLRMGP